MKAEVRFRGLFVIVRHTGHYDGVSKTEAEPMTLVFPSSAGHGGHGGHGGADPSDTHVPKIFISKRALDATGAYPPGLEEIKNSRRQDPLNGEEYVGFSLNGFDAQLPPGEKHEPVAHVPDEAPLQEEPAHVGQFGSFESLSKVPCLNTLTGAELDPAVMRTPAPPSVLTRVRLSGGKLKGVLSLKPLGHGVFEFFDGDGSIAIQPAIEDVVYNAPTTDGKIVLSYTAIRGDKAVRYDYELVPASEPAIVIESMPEAPPKRVDLDARPPFHHFFLYYPLMAGGGRRRPSIRFMSRYDMTQNRIVHRLPPGLMRVDPAAAQRLGLQANHGGHTHVGLGPATTETGCPCFCAEVFWEEW